MSDPVRAAFVVEGITDYYVLCAAAEAVLGGRSLVPTLLQPERSEAFAPVGQATGGGWPGVYRWCRQVVAQSDGVRGNVVLVTHDLLVVQLDADVATATYAQGHIDDDAGDLPCRQACPPPDATTDALRRAMLRWLGEDAVPPRVVLCTPSKATEAWLLAAFHPDDRIVCGGGLECREHPDALLQAKPHTGRLISGGSKNVSAYRDRAAEFRTQWARATTTCSEAARFARELATAAP